MVKRLLYKKFTAIILITIVGLLVLIGSFNFFIDPTGIWGMPLIKDFNYSKPDQIRFERLIKAVDLLEGRAEVLFLGTSRVQNGLDPKIMSNFGYANVYNAAISGASVYEILAYLKHAIHNNSNLKIVVIGVNYEFFLNSKNVKPYNNGFLSERMNRSALLPKDIMDCLISNNILRVSLNALSANLIEKKEFGCLLQKNGAVSDSYVDLYKNGVVRKKIEERTLEKVFTVPKPIHKISDEKMGVYQEIIKICQENNIKLITYIHPLHICWIESYDNKIWNEFEEWKISLSKLTNPVWDFSGYNQVTTEPVDYNMRYYLENSHYAKEAGDMVLEQIFGNREDFGILLDKDKITDQLEQIRSARDIWRYTNKVNKS